MVRTCLGAIERFPDQEYVWDYNYGELITIFGYQKFSDPGQDVPLYVPVLILPNEPHTYYTAEVIVLPRNLEEYLLKFRTKHWQKFLAKWFGFRFCLGYFKKVNHTNYVNWFLFWCDQCKRFTVNFKQGFDNGLDCQRCQDLFLSGPFSKFSN